MVQAAELDLLGVRISEPDALCTPSAEDRIIPFKDILWVRKVPNGVELSYILASHKRTTGKFAQAEVHLRQGDDTNGQDPVDYILDQAYADSEQKKHLLVLINPKGGTGRAAWMFRTQAAPILAAAQCTTEVITTEHETHAEELMKTLEYTKYHAIVCVSGDGLPHQVLNGLASRPDGVKALAATPVCQLPGGSGNALCCSLNGTSDLVMACLGIVKGAPMPTDLMALTQGDKLRYSFLSQSFGVVADCDLGTDNWRWIGDFRFTLGLCVRVFGGRSFKCMIDYKLATPDTSEALLEYYSTRPSTPRRGLDLEYGTVNDEVPSDWIHEEHDRLVVFYVGNLTYMASDAIPFPYATPDDGAMDMIVWDRDVGILGTSRRLLDMHTGAHVHTPGFSYRKILAYRLTPLKEEYVSIDGEPISWEPFQVEVLPQAACLLGPGDFFTTL